MKRFAFVLLILIASVASGQNISTGPARRIFAASGNCPANGWLHYRVITVAAQSSLSGNLTDYPLLISGTYSYLATVANGGLVQNTNGYDVGFFTDTNCTTKLPWEVETWTAGSGLVNYWVQVPSISKTASITFVMAYDNSSISTDQSNKTGTWPSTFQGVYHLPNGTSLTVNDSTSNANNATNNGATATSGKIDGAASFVSASSQYVELASNGNLVATGTAWASSAWVYASSFPGAYNSIIQQNEDSTHVWAMMVKSNGTLALYTVDHVGSVIDYDGTGSHTLSTGTWYLVTMTYSSTAGLVGYVNGAVDGTAAAGSTFPTSEALAVSLGQWGTNNSRFWNGNLDEARIANTALSADWIATDYASQSSPSTFYSVGSQH